MDAAGAGSWRRQNEYVSLPHPNLFLKPIPFGVDERMLRDHFVPYGMLSSVRIVRSPSTVRGASDDHAFVRFTDVRGAQRALGDPNAAVILGQRLTIKVADADVAPKLKSGQLESEWIYCRGLPPNIPADDVLALFSAFGRILDMKYFASTASYKGTGALLRYSCVEDAKGAIVGMNDVQLPGCFQPLLVRFADSPAEKAAKMTRKDLHAKNVARTQPIRDVMLSMAYAMRKQGSGDSCSDGYMSVRSAQSEYQGSPNRTTTAATATHQGSYLSSRGSGSDIGIAQAGVAPPGVGEYYPDRVDRIPDGTLSLLRTGSNGLSASAGQTRVIAINGLPPGADKLWIYENFAVFGAIVGVTMGGAISGDLYKPGSVGSIASQGSQGSEHESDDNNSSPPRRCSPAGFPNRNNFAGDCEAVVTYVNVQDAAKAREAMNGMRVGKSTLSVQLELGAPDAGQLAELSRALGGANLNPAPRSARSDASGVSNLSGISDGLVSPATDFYGSGTGHVNGPQETLAGLQKATAAMNLMSPYSSGFSDQMLATLVSHLSGQGNEGGLGI